jgi:hypothetical protein
MSSSLLAGSAVAESSGVITPDTTAQTSGTATPDSIIDATAPATSETTALEIVPPDQPWGGLTRGDWTARMYQWQVSLPEGVNPYLDATGESCGYGQSGPLFFLSGSALSEPAEFTCVVAAGTAIYVVPASTNCSTVEPPPYFGRTEDELRSCASKAMDWNTDYAARVNGQEVADLESYRTSSPLFTLTFPENNIFGAEPGVAQAVAEAYSFIIAPPPPGKYQIAWSTKYLGQPIGATVTVIVEAPQVIEPPPTT